MDEHRHAYHGTFPDFSNIEEIPHPLTEVAEEIEVVTPAELAIAIALNDCEDLSTKRKAASSKVNSFRDGYGDMYRALVRYATQLKNHIEAPDLHHDPDPIKCLSYFMGITSERAAMITGLCAVVKVAATSKVIWFKELTIEELVPTATYDDEGALRETDIFAKLMNATKPR